jgi:hypothetical protein
MAKEWIETLAQDIKQKNHEAAEDYNREQHKLGIIADKGKPFFDATVACLEDDVLEIRRRLQGDVTSADITLKKINSSEISLTRPRFPWFDARLTHTGAAIVLDYAQGRGVAGVPSLDRRSVHFAYTVAPDDSFSLQQSFSDHPTPFQDPDSLAKEILQLLFQQ